MESQWDDREAAAFAGDDLDMRVYSSRLIGSNPDLVLHGGGNTSVKTTVTNIFGEEEDVVYVKGSGWDLASIERAGFAPVKMNVLERLVQLESLSDTEMVRAQRGAMIDPGAPDPSVEAILHAIIPFKFVDHTHADAVVTITNTEDGMSKIGEIYGDRVFIVPYVMPGFILAREVFEVTRDIDWHEFEGLVLMNHGVFTFGDDARSSYERMIQIVTEAEEYLEREAELEPAPSADHDENLLDLAFLRRQVSDVAGRPMTARVDESDGAVAFSRRDDVADIATRGPLTPDHVIRTKRIPMVVSSAARIEIELEDYTAHYREYFDRHTDGNDACLDPAPRWVVWKGRGTVAFGRGDKNATEVADIVRHTWPAIERAELLGGWDALPESQIFEVEYWELEQAKLSRAVVAPQFQGRVAVVTGAASGIGRACVEFLRAAGACVVGLDIDEAVCEAFSGSGVIGLTCDVTDETSVDSAVASAVRRFGGIDLLVSNAGVFSPSAPIADMPDEDWEQSLAVNLSSHRLMLQRCAPFLKLGIDPAVVIMGSKNVVAPGPGAAAYSVAKAGVTQLARIAAMEMATFGIRVNVVHPNDVFDTALWTPEVLAQRAGQYGLSVDEYRTRNLLGVEITSQDVARLVGSVLGPAFSLTTGAQISIDGGNERVI